jgi:hypothetical protein
MINDDLFYPVTRVRLRLWLIARPGMFIMSVMSLTAIGKRPELS